MDIPRPGAAGAQPPAASGLTTPEPTTPQPTTAGSTTAGPTTPGPTTPQPATAGAAGLEFVNHLVQLSFTVQIILSRAGAAFDLSIIQVRLLGILRDREPTMAQLARFLSLDKSSVTGLVDRAERRGLVRRTAAPQDGRSVQVTVTAEGRRIIETAAGDIERQVLALADGLTSAERDLLATLAGRLVWRDATTRGLNLSTATRPPPPGGNS